MYYYRIEAQKCADIVVADIDRKHFGKPTIDVEPVSLQTMFYNRLYKKLEF